ncbi:lipopolysaccharide biosynthesis protein [Aeromonas simiae]|uniref:lipopolysaccharide biosynthesis protein n=1 Tax=Aeromonas simiae TaxID=218936 RepID=UPI0005A7524F|nr:lipopolysaccharide biosynthesis protein [Aeromonas simiae]
MTQAPDLGAVPRRPWQRLLVGGLLPAGIKIANAGLGYLTTLIAAWLLSPAEYGLFGAVIAFSLLCSFALSYGQPVAMIKFYHEQLVASGERAADRQLSWSLLAGGLCLLLCTLAGALWLFAGKTDARGLGLIVLFCLLFSAGELLSVALRVKERMLAALAPRDALWRALVIAALGLLWLGGKAATTSQLLLLMSLLLLPCLAYQLRLLAPHLSWVWRGEGARLHRRSCAFWGIVLTGPILTQAGTLIVSGSFGLDDSGAYFAAERTSNLLTFLLVAIHIVVGPRLARAFETRDFATTQRLVGLSALLAGGASLLLFVPLALFGNEVLACFSPRYAGQGALLSWLALAQLCNAMAGVTAFFLQMAGFERLTLILSAWFALLSLGLQLLAARLGSLEGVAIVSAGVSLLLNLACILACRRHTGVDSTLLGVFRQGGAFR